MSSATIDLTLVVNPAPAPGGPLLGIFDPSEDQTTIATIATSLGVVSVISDIYAYGTDWTELSSVPAGPMQETIAVGALTPAQATTIAQWLVAHGYTKNYIRIMWEQNGSWYPWGAGGSLGWTAAQYISAYQAIRAAFLAESADFKFVWNLSAGTIPAEGEFARWPGAAYVDVVGIDVYNGYSNYQNLAAILAFAKTQGKPVAFCEWGVGNGSGGAPQQDPATFIEYMAGVILGPANDVAFQIYFNNSTNVLSLYADAGPAYTAAFS